MAKAKEFEGLAMRLKGAKRTIEKNSNGAEQHVVRASNALLRWPVAYEQGDGPY